MQKRMPKIAPISVALVLLCACGGDSVVTPGYSAPEGPAPATGAAPWALPTGPMSLAWQAGLSPATEEFFTYHVHAHLDVFVIGHRVVIPGGIGIDIGAPVVHRTVVDGAPAYGGIKGCPQPCISPLHTHFADGVIHIEAPAPRQFKLGQLFHEWGVPLDERCAGGYCLPDSSITLWVNGKRQTGNPAEILLLDHDEIAIAIGAPPHGIPAAFAFGPNEP